MVTELLAFSSGSYPNYPILGNHDTTGVRAFGRAMAERIFNPARCGLAAGAHGTPKIKNCTTLCGYSLHGLSGSLNLVAARPFSMGSTNGTQLPAYLEKACGNRTLAESSERLKSLIDSVHSPHIP